MLNSPEYLTNKVCELSKYLNETYGLLPLLYSDTTF
jgi:hypothetical protein